MATRKKSLNQRQPGRRGRAGGRRPSRHSGLRNSPSALDMNVAWAEDWIRKYDREGNAAKAFEFRLERARLLGRLNLRDACAICGTAFAPGDETDVPTTEGDIIAVCDECVVR